MIFYITYLSCDEGVILVYISCYMSFRLLLITGLGTENSFRLQTAPMKNVMPPVYPTSRISTHNGQSYDFTNTNSTRDNNPKSRYVGVEAQVVITGSSAATSKATVARVAIVDYDREVLLDSLVRPMSPVRDFRQPITGLEPSYFENAPRFVEVQQVVVSLIQNKILVGYQPWLFLSVFGLRHSAQDTRDVALFVPFRHAVRFREPLTLQSLVWTFMGRNVGRLGYDHPVENARAAMDLYRSQQSNWERMVSDGIWPCRLPPLSFAMHFS